MVKMCVCLQFLALFFYMLCPLDVSRCHAANLSLLGRIEKKGEQNKQPDWRQCNFVLVDETGSCDAGMREGAYFGLCDAGRGDKIRTVQSALISNCTRYSSPWVGSRPTGHRPHWLIGSNRSQ